ncbi:MAG TPA: glycosyltransferase [Paracoccus sp. (in: a-proteobacteria)]|uniref:glycosyltransferase n=1 Tax=Paracoccus sp. TaxID=267 RepID=UPI002D0F54A1|nr:glycosyltransferase [Paracoccus sp. (in: a-proteobacteria)]HWL55538.1 glycosyltransferase [Paracoccus sp. (in: a-proteobacteria)]
MSLVATLRRLGGRVAREAALYPAAVRGRRATRRIAFLPSDARVQSSMLRAYNIAGELEKQGWATLVVPKQLTLAQRRRLLATFRPDMVVVQQCRHPLNRLVHVREWPFVLDIDDADFLDPTLGDALEDMARHASGVICGSRYIRDWAAQFSRNPVVIWTTTPITPRAFVEAGLREPIVTWAQSSPLGYPGELAFVAEVMRGVARLRGGVRLRLYGWDGPRDHPALTAMAGDGVKVELLPFMPYEAFIASLGSAAVGLSPIVPEGFSRGKSFGKILAYLDAKVPVICSDEVDHSLFFTGKSGVVSNDPGDWIAAIARLLEEPRARTAMAEAAYADYTRRLSTGTGGRLTFEYLSGLLGREMRPAV